MRKPDSKLLPLSTEAPHSWLSRRGCSAPSSASGFGGIVEHDFLGPESADTGRVYELLCGCGARFTHTHMYRHVYMHASAYRCSYIRTCTYVYTCVCIRTYNYIYIHVVYTYTAICRCTYVVAGLLNIYVHTYQHMLPQLSVWVFAKKKRPACALRPWVCFGRRREGADAVVHLGVQTCGPGCIRVYAPKS